MSSSNNKLPAADRPKKAPRELLKPMPVKYWSRAGIMLTDWCSAACACCYANCSPAGKSEMSVDFALDLWHQLGKLSPHGCRVHLTGGEIFGDTEKLIELCSRAKSENIAADGATLESVETNAYWADDRGRVSEILTELDRLDMEKLSISCDPYHQCFVPIENVRLLVEIASEILGPDRLKVRWMDWLEEGCNLFEMSSHDRHSFLAEYAASGRDRFVGRAADALDCGTERYSVDQLAENPCDGILLRGKHVHISPDGKIWPATCIGIVCGDASEDSVENIWRNLYENHAQMPVIGQLAESGPVSMLERATEAGYKVRPEGYLSKCHLCFDIRRLLHCKGEFNKYLGPTEVYK